MTLNFGLPRLHGRAQHESEKASKAASQAAEQARQAADKAAEQARIAADQAREAMADAGQRLSSMDMPSIDLKGTLGSARKILGDARKTLADGGEQLAHGAQQVSQGAGKVGHDLRSTVDEVRQLRITKKQGRSPWPGVTLILGVLGGVAAMFLFDPRDGQRRRTELRDKLGKWGRQASETAQGRAKDLANRSQGLIHEVKTAIPVRGDQDQPERLEATINQPEGQPAPDWPSAEPVGSSVGGDYGDVSHDPGAPNGREA